MLIGVGHSLLAMSGQERLAPARGVIPCAETARGGVVGPAKESTLQARGLKASETRYVIRTRAGEAELRFSQDGDAEIEAVFLLSMGLERPEARAEIEDEVERILEEWRRGE
jgi:hypothetical protein